MDVSIDLAMLQEYNQWVTTQKTGARDTSPEEFMRDRLKEVAYDRINAASAYIGGYTSAAQAKGIVLPAVFDNIQAILEGTYVEPGENEENTDDGTEGGAVAEPESEIIEPEYY